MLYQLIVSLIQQLLRILSTYYNKTYPGHSFNIQSFSSHQILLILCGLTIQTGIWEDKFLKESVNELASNYPHVICPRSFVCFTSSKTSNPFEKGSSSTEESASSSSSFNAFSLPIYDREFSMESLEMTIGNYSKLQNKIKKLKELEKVHCRLIQENMELLQQIENKGSYHLSHIHQNLVDGVELSTSIQLNNSFGMNQKSSTEGIKTENNQLFLNELPEFRIREKELEHEKTLEELFWRWVSSGKNSTLEKTAKLQLKSKPKDTTLSILGFQDNDIENWKEILQNTLQLMDNEVLAAISKEKIDLSKVQSQLKEILSVDDEEINNKVDFIGAESCDLRFSNKVIAELMAYPLNLERENKKTESITEKLIALRQANYDQILRLSEKSNEASPFHCIMKDFSETF